MSCACFYEDLKCGGYRMGICPLHATTSCSRAEQREYIKRICEENMERTSKQLTLPEVVQALLDGRTVAYRCLGAAMEVRYVHGQIKYRVPSGAVTAWIVDEGFRLQSLLNGHISNCHIVPTTYDWTEARKRGERHTVRLRSVVSKKEYMFPLDPNVQLRLFEIDGQWEDA